MSRKKLNLIGQKFNRLTILKELKQIGAERWYKCKCDCGKLTNVRQGDLIRKYNATRSCGCARLRGKYSHSSRYYIDRRLTKIGQVNYLFYAAKKGAEKKNLKFTITKKQILNKLNINYCEVTGIKFEINEKIHEPFAPSIDRIDSNKGYTLDNIQLVCWIYNRTKGNGTHKDVIRLCQALVNKAREKEAQNLLKIADIII